MSVRLLLGGVLVSVLILGGCSQEPPYGTTSQEAIAAYDKGMDDFGKFYYAEALKAFERATEADSGFAIAWARIAPDLVFAAGAILLLVFVGRAIWLTFVKKIELVEGDRHWYPPQQKGLNKADKDA